MPTSLQHMRSCPSSPFALGESTPGNRYQQETKSKQWNSHLRNKKSNRQRVTHNRRFKSSKNLKTTNKNTTKTVHYQNNGNISKGQAFKSVNLVPSPKREIILDHPHRRSPQIFRLPEYLKQVSAISILWQAQRVFIGNLPRHS